MERFKNIQEYLDNNVYDTRADIKELILQSALDLLGDCAHNFEGDASVSERASQPLYLLNDILDRVE